MSEEWTPPGRPSPFTVPQFGTNQMADLVAIIKALATDCVNLAGDDMVGDFTITGILDATAMKYAGVTGQLLTICTSGTHPGTGGDYPLIYETDTNDVLGWNGSAYAAIAGSGAGYSSRFLLMGA